MPLVRHRAKIDADMEAIWDHLLRKIEKPEDYVPAVARSEILSRPTPDVVERLMFLLGEDGEERPTHEIIAFDHDTRTIIFLLRDSPAFTGLVTNTVLETDDGLVLDITMNWVEKPGIPSQDHVDWQAMVMDAVEQTKRQVESGVAASR